MTRIAIIGAGIAGMATAARLQAQGCTTTVFEAHTKIGGCAGYFRRRGFAFDVGATTLVDFETGGVGGDLLENIGLSVFDAEALPGYQAWLPDRTLTLHRDTALWSSERLNKLGDSPAHRDLWALLDKLAEVFWQAARHGVKLPMRTATDIMRNLRALDVTQIPLARYMQWTMGDALRHFGLRDDQPLTALLAMLIEDTVHSTLDEAPLINAALGITIRGAGLSRHTGGMYGFWRTFNEQYQRLGGEVQLGCRVEQVEGRKGSFRLRTNRGVFEADQVVCAVPAHLAVKIAPTLVGQALQPYVKRDQQAQGSAVIVFLGVPEMEVNHQTLTHHQLLHDYQQPLGSGNNMFISVSAPGDTLSAPAGYRAVMISTHCDVEPWQGLTDELYESQKQAIGKHLIHLARRVYPCLGEEARVYEIGTPRTYETFAERFAVGGVRQNLSNSNQHAIPYDLGAPGFWLVGDSTWPGLGTVACVLGSRHVAEGVIGLAQKSIKSSQTADAQRLKAFPSVKRVPIVERSQ